MLTDDNRIFRNWFVIIHLNLTKISAQIIQCQIFERNELYNTIYSMLKLLGKSARTQVILSRERSTTLYNYVYLKDNTAYCAKY